VIICDHYSHWSLQRNTGLTSVAVFSISPDVAPTILDLVFGPVGPEDAADVEKLIIAFLNAQTSWASPSG
jgi:hypothetical protein